MDGIQFDVIVRLPPGVESVSTGEGDFGLHPDLDVMSKRKKRVEPNKKKNKEDRREKKEQGCDETR